jgi:hypothetical protein
MLGAEELPPLQRFARISIDARVMTSITGGAGDSAADAVSEATSSSAGRSAFFIEKGRKNSVDINSTAVRQCKVKLP